MAFFFAEVKMFRFWLKTMGYNKAFWSNLSSFFVVLLLRNGRCYEAEIWTILLLLICTFAWNPFLQTFFGLPKIKPWTIVHGFRPENGNFDFGFK